MTRAAPLLVFLALSTTARAQGTPEQVFANAEDRIASFEYAEAVALLEDLVAREPGPEVELRARSLIVRAEASRGDAEAARAAAAALYERDPGVDLDLGDAVSPRIRSFFVEAQRAARSAPAAEASVRVRSSDDRVRLRVSAETGAMIDRVQVQVQEDGAFVAHPAERSDGGGYSLVLPWAPALRYYVRFLAPSGHVVAEAGSPEVPLSWTAAAQVEGSADPLDGVTEESSRSRAPLVLGIVAAVVAVALAVTLAVWRPWQDQATLDRGVMLP